MKHCHYRVYSTRLKKSENLFNIQNIKESNELLIVEGIFDCLHAEIKGFNNVVALGGSSISDSQLKIIKNKSIKQIILCLDNDLAGFEARNRIISKLKSFDQSIKVKVMDLPKGIKDLDQLFTIYS